jgi:transposase-like protein
LVQPSRVARIVPRSPTAHLVSALAKSTAAAREKALQVIEKLRALRLTTAAELAVATFDETLSYCRFPEEHWRRIRTNNPLERVLREIERSEPSRMANRPSISPPHACGTSPGPLGPPRDT